MTNDGLITDEIVEVTARALAQVPPGENWPTNEALGGSLTGTRDDEYRDAMREEARWALEAAAPLIAARALEEAADDWRSGLWAAAPRRTDRVQERIANGQFVQDWLRQRAAREKEGRG